MKLILIALLFFIATYANPAYLNAAVDAAKVEGEKAQLEQLNKDLEVLKNKNPFSLPFSKVIKPSAMIPTPLAVSTLNLTGIISDRERPAAIINDMIVSEGDVMEMKGKRIKVKKIGKDSAILIEDGKEYKLELKVFWGEQNERETQIYKGSTF